MSNMLTSDIDSRQTHAIGKRVWSWVMVVLECALAVAVIGEGTCTARQGITTGKILINY